MNTSAVVDQIQQILKEQRIDAFYYLDTLKIDKDDMSLVLAILSFLGGVVLIWMGLMSSLVIAGFGLTLLLSPFIYNQWFFPDLIEFQFQHSIMKLRKMGVVNQMIEFSDIKEANVEAYLHSTFVSYFHPNNKEYVYELRFELNTSKKVKAMKFVSPKPIDRQMQELAFLMNELMNKNDQDLN